MSSFFAKTVARVTQWENIFGVLRGNRYSSVLSLVIVSDDKMVNFRKVFGARSYLVLRYYSDFANIRIVNIYP